MDLININYTGKRIKLVFDDGSGRVSIRVGTCRGNSGGILFIDTDDRGVEGIGLSKIIRIEKLGGKE